MSSPRFFTPFLSTTSVEPLSGTLVVADALRATLMGRAAAVATE